jgi:predicted RNA binding protein YcfA (HicA-like mRNA interferase family)
MIPATGKETVRAFEKIGWRIARWHGSHAIMEKGERILTVPCHSTKTLPIGTQRAIIKDAGISVERFNELLKG